MKTLKKAIVVLMLALSALPAFAQDIPIDPDGDGLPNGIDLCPLAYGSGSDGCPSGNYATRRPPTLNAGEYATIVDFQLNSSPIIEK